MNLRTFEDAEIIRLTKELENEVLHNKINSLLELKANKQINLFHRA